MSLTAFLPFLTPIFDWFTASSKRKAVRLENELQLANAITMAKIKAAQQGDLNVAAWENTALQNAGIKDEVMMIVVLAPMIMCFFPGGDVIVRNGFLAMTESLPEYWEYAFYATIGVSYGVRKLTDFMQFKRGG